MILTNYKRPNYFKDLIESFSDENRHFSFGSVKGFSSEKYKWVADYLFKHRNNTQTNKHRAFIAFFNNKDTALSEYGNILELQQTFDILDGQEKTKFPKFYYEMSSSQYKRIGQEYTEFDDIEYIDASGIIFSNNDAGTLYDLILGSAYLLDGEEKRLVDINHTYGDAPVYVAVGYKFYEYETGIDKFIWDNPPEGVEINFNNFKVILNDNDKDLYTHPKFKQYIESSQSTPITSGTILINLIGSGSFTSEESILTGAGTLTP